jgi:uncharacterized protein (DUF1501 family)
MTTAPSPTPACCSEFARVSRRGLLGGGLAVAGTTTVLGSAVITASPAMAATTDSVLVVLSMRGAADGLSLAVPYTDPLYYQARPRIGVPADSLVGRNGTFGFHPELAPLMPLWEAGEMAVVQGAGLPTPNRSHFSAMEELEDAAPGSDARVGWLNRLVGGIASGSPLTGFNMGGGVVPTSLTGPVDVMAAGSVDRVGFAGDDEWDQGERLRSLHALWDGNTGPLGRAMRSAFRAVSSFAPAQAQPSHDSRYPRGDLGRGLAEVARIVRGNVGTSVITIDTGSWDMHADLGTLQWGGMKRMTADFAAALAAFFNDLGTQRHKVTLVAFSEFGRRVQENSNYGLDHGYGNAMWLFGRGVKGKEHYGTLQPLANQLDSDVLVTTDYRSVLSEIVAARFPAVSTASVFPGFQPETVGVMTSL